MNYFINRILICLLPLIILKVNAHELWMLTPEQVKYLNNKAKPIIFTQIDFINIIIVLAFLLLIMGWIYFNRRIKINYLDSKLRSYSPWSAIILQLSTACMLVICAFNLIPRKGLALNHLTALLAPDLVLSPESNWYWLKYLQLLISVCFILSIFIRGAVIFLLFLCLIALYLFGEQALPYIFFYIGISLFLYTQRPRKEVLFANKKDNKKILSLNLSTFLLQLLTGIAFIYSAVSYKFLQPNLDIAILYESKAFTFGIPTDYFVFIMALVEIGAGILIISGYGLRMISIFLLALFTFLSFDVSENIIVHIFIYGILTVFIINGGTSFTSAKKVLKNH